jgi:hypothetical protein
MGTYIESYAEVRNTITGKWEKVSGLFPLDEYRRKDCVIDKGDHPFDWQSYSMFGFLAGVRNYSLCEPISQPKGLPDDVSEDIRRKAEHWIADAYSHSWFTLQELLAFNYEKVFEDMRDVLEQIAQSSEQPIEPGIEPLDVSYELILAASVKAKLITYSEHLGKDFFDSLNLLKTLGKPEDVRVVFWFHG